MQKLVRVGVVGVLLVLGGVRSSYAQNAGPASKLTWDEIGEVPSVANGSTYNIYDTKPDNSQAVIQVNSATCVQGPTAADSTCTIPFPALVPGKHTLTLTQVQSGAESNKSVPLVVTFVLIITPTSVRVSP